MQIIKTTHDLATACEQLSQRAFVTVDTEFLREKTYWPKLCLVQLAGEGIEMIVDPLASGIDLTPFFELMANESVVKVFHAARQDVEIVYNLARIIPKPLFDSQVAAMVCGFGDQVSYVNLVEKLLGEELDKSSRYTDWSRRPLSSKQLNYALGDVTHLRSVYKLLSEQLVKTGRSSWLEEEVAVLSDPATYLVEPENAWKRLKMRVRKPQQLSVMMEVAAWREARAQEIDVPRGRVLKDDAIYDIANQMPTEPSRLEKLRSLSKGFSRSSQAKEIVAAVKRGLDKDPSQIPPIKQGQRLPKEAFATVEMLRVLLKAVTAKHDVAPKLIANAADLEKIAIDDNADVPSLKGWRREMFGNHALALKHGKLALGIVNGAVEVIPTDFGSGVTSASTASVAASE